MKVTVTNATKTLPELMTTASIDWANFVTAGTNVTSVYIENPTGGNTIYIETLAAATTAKGKAIAGGTSFAVGINDMRLLSFITATTQEIVILVS